MRLDQLEMLCRRAISAKHNHASVGSRTGHLWSGLWTLAFDKDGIHDLTLREVTFEGGKFDVSDAPPIHVAIDEIATIRFSRLEFES